MNQSPTIRCYAQQTILDNYMTYIGKLLNKYDYFFKILAPIKLGTNFQVNSKTLHSDISILIMRESEVTKESQDKWFMRMIKDVKNITNKNILIIVFSEIDNLIANVRKFSYESQISDSTIVYLDFEDWFPINTEDSFNRHYKMLPMLDSSIVEFMMFIMSNIYMY